MTAVPPRYTGRFLPFPWGSDPGAAVPQPGFLGGSGPGMAPEGSLSSSTSTIWSFKNPPRRRLYSSHAARQYASFKTGRHRAACSLASSFLLFGKCLYAVYHGSRPAFNCFQTEIKNPKIFHIDISRSSMKAGHPVVYWFCPILSPKNGSSRSDRIDGGLSG